MEINIDKLKNIAQETPAGTTTPDKEKSASDGQYKPNFGKLERIAQTSKEKRELDEKATAQAGENKAETERIKSEILKAVKAGESPIKLFLQAAQAVSLATSDSLFYTQIAEDVLAIYGHGLLEPEPLKEELEGVRGRLETLKGNLEREKTAGQCDSQHQKLLEAAIKKHSQRVDILTGMIEDGNKTKAV